MVEEEKKSHKRGHKHVARSSKVPGKRPTNVIKSNPWILATIILVAVLIVLLIVNYSGGSSGEKVGKNFVNFINSKGDAQINYVSVSDFSPDLYEVVVSAGGSQIPVYVTKDGKYFVQIISEINSTEDNGDDDNLNSETGVPKSDRPSVELFIWSYCPYGVTAQAPLSEVAALLEDYADFRAVLYYAGHGDHEVQENKIQECIQQIAPDKYWEYAGKFVEQIYPSCGSSRDVECDLTQSTNLMNSLGIDSSAVLACVDSQGESLSKDDYALAQQMGVTGSPTLVINGQIVNVARNSEAFKTAICQAFTDGNSPSACDEVLSSTGSEASGNC